MTDIIDALTAAPKHHKLLFENEYVRVLDTSIPPIRYDSEGNVIFDSRGLSKPLTEASALWSEPLSPHALKNTGNKKLHIISVEVKS